MIQMLVDGSYRQIELKHIRMNFSESLHDIGRVKFAKVLHLVSVILKIYWAKLTFRPEVLYYPPAGPNKVPLIRDAAILLATRFLFRKTVYHFQASGCSQMIPNLPTALRRIVMFALSKPDLAIELSEYTAPDGEFLKARRIVRVPNAAADHSSRFELRHQSVLPEANQARRSTQVLYLGTMCEEKGALEIVKAFRNLRQNREDFHIHFVGGFQPESFRQTIENEIAESGLSGFATIHGQRTGDDKWRMLAEADLFCFPSYYSSEGFPCVLVEAMSFSLPVVSTHWRGIPSIVSEGETGFLVTPRDTLALTECLNKLLESPELRTQMGRAGRLKYLSEFTQEKYRESMEQVLVETARPLR